MTQICESFIAIRNEYHKKGKLYEDDEFPATERSIDDEDITEVKWLRPKELVKTPKFFVDGFSRFDVIQGALQNCWLVSAIANLAKNRTLFRRIVPNDQTFENDYAGMFYFVFWKYGKWVSICIDDRLPTDGKGNLLFMKSPDSNEFWSALLEKAYAKLIGSYGALNWGSTSEAMVDFTGGVTETVALENVSSDFFEILNRGFEKQSMMSCFISKNSAVESQGLHEKHSYSITQLKDIKGTKLIRLRDPAGIDSWDGAFSDGSKTWNIIPDNIKQEINLIDDEDGEFWIEFKDFTKHFDFIEICNLSPDLLFINSSHRNNDMWELSQFHGEWISGSTAAGCRAADNDKFWCNPQYFITIENPSKKVNKCVLIVDLKQKDRLQGLTDIGFSIFLITDEDRNSEYIDERYFNKRQLVKETKMYHSTREVSQDYEISPGNYVIIPTTLDRDVSSKYMLRIFCNFKIRANHKLNKQ